MGSHSEYTNDREGLKDIFTLTLTSPFVSQRAFPEDKARSIFLEASDQALITVQKQEVLDQISEKDEILLIFDALLVDYAFIAENVHSEELKATVSKFDLATQPSLQIHIDAIVDKLYELNSQYEEN